MNPLIIEQSEFSPQVTLDPVNLKFQISGESRPENAGKFYEPIISWLEQYKSVLFWQKEKFGAPQKLDFIFKFEYFNSTSAKYILDLLKQIDLYHADGNEIRVQWYYDKLDEDMKDSGEEFSKLLNVPFDFIGQ